MDTILRVIVVDENNIAGHFSFDSQFDRMMELYESGPELFE